MEAEVERLERLEAADPAGKLPPVFATNAVKLAGRPPVASKSKGSIIGEYTL